MSELKTRYKYINFRVINELSGRKTKVWGCFNNNDDELPLFEIKWYGRWRQYCSFFDPLLHFNEIVMNNSCHRDIADFLDQINKRIKQKGKPG